MVVNLFGLYSSLNSQLSVPENTGFQHFKVFNSTTVTIASLANHHIVKL